jgi:VanZ family protein
VRSGVAAAAVIGAALLIALATLTPQPPNPALGLDHWCLVCGQIGGADVTLNVLLFVPLGAALALAGVRWRALIPLVAAYTIGIELAQLLVIPGRDATLSDVLSNTTGGVLGALAARHWQWWLRARDGRALALGCGAALAWTAVVTGTAWLLQPSLPDIQLYGQPAINTPEFEPYAGRIGAITVNGRQLLNAPLPADARLVESFRAGRVRITADVTAPARATRERSAAIARLGDTNVEGLLLAQRGRDLLFKIRLHTADARLRTPAMALGGALVGPDVHAGEAIRLSGR